MQPLRKTRILEWADASVAPSVCRAIALAGRIAADFGASVIHGGEGMAAFYRSAPAYLAIGKSASAGMAVNTDAVLLGQGAQNAAAASPARAVVTVSLKPAAEELSPASAFTIMASAGVLDVIGDPERAPLRLPGAQLDLSAGLSAYTALAGLLVGGGGKASVSLLDVAIWLNWKNIVMAHVNGTAPSRKGRGAEWQTLRCKDGWVALVYREGDWAAVKKLIGDPALDTLELEDRGVRRRNAKWIADRAEQAFSTMTRSDIAAFSRANRIPLGPVQLPQELFDEPQYRERGFFAETESGLMPRLPVLWNGAAFQPGGRSA
jgi:crotonobetainyl-CoA:carnitine CoA-transferase CaiB-like acyl-CoA transferase